MYEEIFSRRLRSDREPKRLRRLEVNRQFELGGLLDRRSPGLVPLSILSTYPAARRRRRLRDEWSRPIVREIQTWALDQRVLPESSLGKAISYLLGLWSGLTRFLDDSRIPLDNNQTERGLRGVVLGRRNHHGSRSRRGTEVAALFYSLVESAKLCGVEPKRYRLTATRAALADHTVVTLPRDLLVAYGKGVCPPVPRVAE
jgi:transposase IS66 family protein